MSRDNFVEIRIGKAIEWALVNTGAQVPCVRRDIWQKQGARLLPNDRISKTVSGSPMPILDRGCVEIKIQGRTLKLQRYVAEQLNHHTMG